MAGRRDQTALGTARARFVEGLPRKAQELKGAVALLAGTPDAARPREELRRRLHALYASAQVFRIGPLADALRDAIKHLDSARDAHRALTSEEVESLASLSATLPGLATDGESGAPSTSPPKIDSGRVPPPPRASERSPKATLMGLAPQDQEQDQEQVQERTAESAPAKDAGPGEPAATVADVAAAEPTREETEAREPEARRPSSMPPRPSGSFTAARPPSDVPSRPAAPLDTIISVLVVDDVETQTLVRAALPSERFELVGASDPEQGLRLARMGAPDVVVANRELVGRPGVDFVTRLRSDPLTDFVPVVLLLPAGSAQDLIAVREEGADATLGKPFEKDELVRTLARVTGSTDDASPFDFLGDVTTAEIADRVAEEVRRGIVEAAETGRDVRVPLGDGAEVLAAAWSAIARMRASIAQRSGGRVRFRDSARRGGPAVMALVDDETEEEVARDTAFEVSLAGRRIVVADDDPAVVWFFAGLLREEEADVFEAADGREALDEAARRRPDLIISDILMPEVDGFELCRELQRDPALTDVPVILLSWKEDFLQRMRDLSAGASGYLRKEAGSAQILARVRDVLRPLARLEAQLEAGGEVRGRIEGIGILTLLRTVSAHRPDSRVTVRDAWNLFEVDVRDGDLVEVTRTATDGSFARGPRALPQLIGVATGRFTVTDGEGPVRSTFDGSLEDSLRVGTARLGAVLDTVSGKGMHRAESVSFDEDVLASFTRTSPEPIKRLVERMKRGEGPRALLADDDVAPQALESALVDLARRGAIADVRGPGGEDLVAEALRARGVDDGPGPAVTSASAPPAAPVEETEPAEDEKPAGAAAGEGLSWLKSEETTGDIVAAAHRMAEEKGRRRRRRRDSVDELDDPFTGGDEEEGEASTSRPPAALGDDEAPAPPREEAAAPTPSPGLSEAERSEIEPTTEWRPRDLGVDATDVEGPEPLALSRQKPLPGPPERPARPARRPPAPPPDTKRRPPAPPARSEGRAAPRPPPPTIEPSDEVQDAVERASVQPEAGSEPGTLGWIFLLIVLAVIGFVGYELVEGSLEPEPEAPAEATAPAGGEPMGGEGDTERAEGEGGGDEGADLEGVPPQELSFGRVLPYVDAGDLEVTAEQGLLVVEVDGDAPGPEVSVGDRELGPAPVRVALPAGRHELVFRRGEELSYRYLYLRAGQTRIVTAP